jgi:regulatory protein
MPTHPLKEIRQRALTLLAIREHSELELRRKLLTKGFPAEQIDTLLPLLIQENLLSNHRFLENYIRYRQQKGYGPIRIHAELNARGISEDMIEDHLNIADNAWLTSVRTVWRKRFKSVVPADSRARGQQQRFLQYRGFTLDQIDTIFQSDREHA